jgi:EAL domain-containing protein (putative c-di-GMP-specific phosphodiesterase class I)
MTQNIPHSHASRLLIVDANPETREFTAAVARALGFLVATAADAVECRTRSQELAPTVILLDPTGLGTNEIEMFRWLRREHGAAALIIACDAGPDVLGLAEELGLAYGLHVNVALSRPLTAPALEAALEPLLDVSRRLTERDLRRAIERSQLVVHYQPKVLINPGECAITGVEALLRWDHPDHGLIHPEAFIGLAEQHGLIDALTDFVLQTGIEQIAEWNRLGLKLDLSVNLSSKLVTDADFPARMREFLAVRKVDPAQLTLEVQETAMFENPHGTAELLAGLRETGVGLSLDDFGTGYSSLTQLYALPFSEVKIDRSLGMDLGGNDSSRGMVRAIIDLAHRIGLTVCCEGVESDAALGFLRSAGCDYAQGYYIARPMSVRDIARWLAGANDGALRMAS